MLTLFTCLLALLERSLEPCTHILGEQLKMLELKTRSTKKKKDPIPAASTLGAKQGFLSLASDFSSEAVM